MENMQITTIKDALINAPHLLWSNSLFLPDTLAWELETKAIICNPDDVESEDDEIPKIANIDFMSISCHNYQYQKLNITNQKKGRY